MQIPIVSTSLPNVLVVNHPEFAEKQLASLSSHANPIFIEQAGRDKFIPRLNELVRSTPGGFKACIFFMRWSEFPNLPFFRPGEREVMVGGVFSDLAFLRSPLSFVRQTSLLPSLWTRVLPTFSSRREDANFLLLEGLGTIRSARTLSFGPWAKVELTSRELGRFLFLS